MLTMLKPSGTINISQGKPPPASSSSQKIILSGNILGKPHLKVGYNLHRPYHNPRLERKEHYLAKSAARRAVALARATRLAIKTKERSLSARITEVEEYVGLLRQKRAVVRNRAAEADEQMGIALHQLHQHGLTEQALSDCELGDEDCEDELLNYRFYPPSSDYVYSDNVLSDAYASSSNGDSEASDDSSPVTSIQPDESAKKLL